MKNSIIIFLFCVSNFTFGQIIHPISTNQLIYTFNNNSDTLFFSTPTIFKQSPPIGIIYRNFECKIELINTIDLNKTGLNECVFLKTCQGGGEGFPMDCSHGEEKITLKTYEIWDLDKKEQLFCATFSYNHQYYFGQCGGPNYSINNVYSYIFKIESDRITISNLKMESSKIEYDSVDQFYRSFNSIQIDNEIGIYLFDGHRFVKQAPIETIRSIFNGYMSSYESIDTEINKDLMTESLKSLTIITDKNEFDLLLNVWMYYNPTDYPYNPEIYRILKNSRPQSIEAVKNRINHKKEGENNDSAPYSSLKNLLQQLENE